MDLKPPSWMGAKLRRNPLPSTYLALDSVRKKLLRVILLTTALALTVSGIAMLTHELYVYQTSWAVDIATEASIIALSTAPAMAFDDQVAAKRNLDSLETRRRVMAAALYGADGKMFASFARAGQRPAPATPPADGLWGSGENLELAQPVGRNGERLGTIYVRAQYDLEGRIGAYAGIFLLATLLSMAAAYVLSKRMQKSITEPLDAIAGVAYSIVSGSDYSLRAAKISDDEIGVVVDAFNKMLEEVQSRTRALGEADRRKDEFLATLAHELRNPLAPIRHAVKLLDAKNIDERQRQWAREVISRQVQRMALLLDDLLDVSRITRGRLDLKVEHVDVESLIRAAVETARPLIDAKQHRLRVELPPQAVVVAVDPLRVSQSLSNLLTNAAKYTDAQGRITLSVRVSDSGIAMSVKDNGIGFEARMLPELFEMFSQVDTAISRSEGGLGIGLALVKGLIAMHGGTVEGSSAGLGQGSEFTIRLPRSTVVQTAAPGASVTPGSPAPGSGSPGLPATLAAPAEPGRGGPDGACRLTVLVVDDNRDAADSLALLLQMHGHEVLVAHCGEDALAMALRARPRAVILDIGMPDMSGYEVARRLRAEPGFWNTLLVAVTGWGQTDDKARALAAGFDHHLTKPVDPDEVEQLLHDGIGAPQGNVGAAG